jgi:hypothetical protein
MKYVGIDLHKQAITLCAVNQERQVDGDVQQTTVTHSLHRRLDKPFSMDGGVLRIVFHGDVRASDDPE